MPSKELKEAYSNNIVRQSVRCISHILFEAGIPNLVCGCILGLLYIQKMLTNREMVNFQKWDFLCPQRNFGRHIVIALSARPSVRPVQISYII